MKKLIIFFFILFFSFNIFSNQKYSNPNSGDRNFQFQKATIPDFSLGQNQVTNYASSRSGSTLARAFQISGITCIVSGVIFVGVGIPMIVINAVGLGYAKSDSFEVIYFDNNKSYGLIAFYSGVGLLIAGGLLLTPGITLTTIGFLMGPSRRAKVYMENNQPEIVRVGLKFSL